MDSTQVKAKKTRTAAEPKAPKAAKAAKAPKEPKVAKEAKVSKPKKEVAPKKPPTQPKVDDSLTFVATSRIKTYINDNRLNKDVNHLLSVIKNAREFKTDLNQLLSAEQMQTVGQYRSDQLKLEAKRVESNAKSGKTPEKEEPSVSNMDPYTVAEKAFTRSKVKFSKDSFQVVGIVMDKILYELVVHTMDNMLEQPKVPTSISIKCVSADKTSPLYPIYNNSKTFKSLETVPASSTDEEAPADESTDDTSTDTNVNFECYIRKVIDRVKVSDDKYLGFKNSSPFKKFCSDLVLDVLERICNILETISVNLHVKTINKELFTTIFKIMICDQNGANSCDKQLFADVESVLSELVKQRDEQKSKRDAEKESSD